MNMFMGTCLHREHQPFSIARLIQNRNVGFRSLRPYYIVILQEAFLLLQTSKRKPALIANKFFCLPQKTAIFLFLPYLRSE